MLDTLPFVVIFSLALIVAMVFASTLWYFKVANEQQSLYSEM
jgi:hypothetical protein